MDRLLNAHNFLSFLKNAQILCTDSNANNTSTYGVFPYDDNRDELNEGFIYAATLDGERDFGDQYLILLLKAGRRKTLIVFTSFFLVFSLLVNTLSLVVLCRRSFLLNSYAFGQRFLSMTDMGFALFVTLGYLIQGVSNVDLSEWSTEVCLAFRTTAFILAATSNWTVVYLSTIRYLGMSNPLKIHSNIYLKGSYAVLVALSFANSLFYVTFYLSLDRFIALRHTSSTTIGYCREYSMDSINMYVIRCILMMPETILPGIFVVILNTKTYLGFGDIARQAVILKHKLNIHTVRISKLRKSLHKDELVSKNLLKTDDEKKGSLSGSSSASIAIASSYSQFFTRTMERLSSTKQSDTPASPVITFATEQVTPNLLNNKLDIESRRKRIIRKLFRERQKLRRVTVTYGLLCEGVVPENPRQQKLLREPQRVSTPSQDNETNWCQMCQSCLALASPFARKLIIISTLLFILLNGPYCLWFIFSNAIFSQTRLGVAGNGLTNAIVVVLKCSFHASNCIVYILSSSKVRSQVDVLLKRLQCCK